MKLAPLFAAAAGMAVGSVVVADAAVAAPMYEIKALDATGAALTFPKDINNLGVVVGYTQAADGSANSSKAVVWDATGVRNLPFLSQTNQISEAYRINDAGQIVGKGRTDANQSHALFWPSAGGTPVDVGTLGGVHSFANDINEAGVVVGSAAAANNGTRAFRWTQAGGIVDDGNLNPNSAGANAGWNGVNASGLAVGTAYQIFSPFKASKGLPGDRNPTVISPSGQFSTGMAMAVNDAGLIVGYQNPGSGSPHAAIFNGDGTVQDLGTLGFDESQALDVNESGVIVGAAFGFDDLGNLLSTAFVHTGGQMHDVRDLLVDGAGWTQFFDATSVNDLGQIVGSGVFNGEMRGFVLTPVPEPTAAGALLAVAGTVLAGRRRRGA